MPAATMKYSRQREAVREFLMSRKDHPTAETVYKNLREKFPHISLGTVYRNLALLVELGEAVKLPGIGGFDRFDGNTAPHYHFICENCGAVMDLDMPQLPYINDAAEKNFDGTITGHLAFFYGKCGKCKTTAEHAHSDSGT